MYKVRCTEVTFSANRWEDVILRFDVLKEDAETYKEHLVRREDVTLPFYSVEVYTDRKTGETKERRHSCMVQGDFSKTFRHAITTKAMRHFYPGEIDIFLKMTEVALKICGTHELAQCATPDEFLDNVKYLLNLREEALKEHAGSNGKSLLKTIYAWQLYRSIIEVFDRWAREVKLAEPEEDDEIDDIDKTENEE